MHRRILCLAFPILVVAGCGQKGPLYLDDSKGEAIKTVTPEDEARQRQIKELERRNESQPVITY